MGRRSGALTLGRVLGLLVAILVGLALAAPPAFAHGRVHSDNKHRPAHATSQQTRGVQHHKAKESGKQLQSGHSSRGQGASSTGHSNDKSPARPANKSTTRSSEPGKNGASHRPSAPDWTAADTAERTVSTPTPLPTEITSGGTADLQSNTTDSGLLGGLLGGVTDAAGGLLGGIVSGAASTVVHVRGVLGGLLGTHRRTPGPAHVPAPPASEPPVTQPHPTAPSAVTPVPASPQGRPGAPAGNTQRPGTPAAGNTATTPLRAAPTTAPALSQYPSARATTSAPQPNFSRSTTPPVAVPDLHNTSLTRGVTLPLLGVLLLFALGVLAVVVTAGYRGRRVH